LENELQEAGHTTAKVEEEKKPKLSSSSLAKKKKRTSRKTKITNNHLDIDLSKDYVAS